MTGAVCAKGSAHAKETLQGVKEKVVQVSQMFAGLVKMVQSCQQQFCLLAFWLGLPFELSRILSMFLWNLESPLSTSWSFAGQTFSLISSK